MQNWDSIDLNPFGLNSRDVEEIGPCYIVSLCITRIAAFYSVATEGLSKDSGHTGLLTPDAVYGCFLRQAAKKMIFELPTPQRLAVLSTSWSQVECAEKLFREEINRFDAKIEEVKALNPCWDGRVNIERVRQIFDSQLYKALDEYVEAMSSVPRVPSIMRAKLPELAALPDVPTFEYAKLESPNDTIRVVRMESISDSDRLPIFLKTRTIRLRDNVPFATLFYTWGNPFGIFCSEKERDTAPPTDIPIICDGKRLEVGENLYRFLVRWRLYLANFDHSVPRTLAPDQVEACRPPTEFWIDAICINQQDIEEKNKQVSIMGEIYNKSTKTWVWLGEEDEFSGAAFKILGILATAAGSIDDKAGKRHLDELERKALLVKLGLPGQIPWNWFAVFALFERQWFRRSWVVQEATLSRSIYALCGQHYWSWSAFVTAYSQLNSLQLRTEICALASLELTPERLEPTRIKREDSCPLHGRSTAEERGTFKKSMKSLSDMRFHICHEGTQVDMAEVLFRITAMRLKDPDISDDGVGIDGGTLRSMTHIPALWELSRRTLCYDPRDKVYALASLVNRNVYRTPDTVQDRRPLVPDYNKSVCEVYCDAAWFTLLTQANLSILSLIGNIAHESEHGLPSWVPDLSQPPQSLAFWTIQDRKQEPLWSADAGTRWKIPPLAMRYQKLLAVEVSFVGKVSGTSHGEIKYNRKKRDGIDYKDFLAFYKLLPPTYLGDADGQNAFEVFWRTMIADFANETSPAPPKYAQEFGKSYIIALRDAADDCIVGNIDNNDLASIYSTMKEVAGEGMLAGDAEKMYVDTDETKEFGQRVFNTMDKRRLFIADTGHVGCGDARLSVGDMVAVIAGYPIPFILRQGSGGRYKAIGEAYVHGIMLGEHAMKPDVEWESIVLE
jgi:hypothetical protein